MDIMSRIQPWWRCSRCRGSARRQKFSGGHDWYTCFTACTACRRQQEQMGKPVLGLADAGRSALVHQLHPWC